jgi:hypothetical protein
MDTTHKKSFMKQYKDVKNILKTGSGGKLKGSNIRRLKRTFKDPKNKKLLETYGAAAGNSRAFNTEYKASGGNVAQYYGKGGRVAGCGPARNKK